MIVLHQTLDLLLLRLYVRNLYMYSLCPIVNTTSDTSAQMSEQTPAPDARPLPRAPRLLLCFPSVCMWGPPAAAWLPARTLGPPAPAPYQACQDCLLLRPLPTPDHETFFLRITQYNVDVHNTHAHSPL